MNKQQFKQFIENFDFTSLFNQLGWNYLDEQTSVKLKEETYLFHSVAEKGGFRILVFKPAKHQDLPDYATRLQLDRKIGKLYREHLIIFCDKNNTTQIWQLFVKQLGKPSRLSETRWHKGQEPELLYQKTSNLFFTLDQEENITIADVVDVVNENFSKNVEQVTKKFYENFRKEHKKFIEFIKGISVVTDREWYASLMLNRLMFCYFIQKKGFLDNNLNYLKDKLTYCQTKKGKDKFYVSFYRNFLIALFHQGLGSPDQSEELKKEIGKIPYLNGGLFDVHELEIKYENIDISDEAFEAIFNFFDQYNWHLDTKISATGKDINPDVIGFIFEKYINDRAKMGAYYTKEDITDYISKNCIIPFLFDETERKYAKAFQQDSEIWKMLKESGDTYIYDAVKKGINTDSLDFNTDLDIDNPDHPIWSDLPEEIRAGFRPDLTDKVVVADDEIHLWQIRKPWNQPAPESIALPTEIYRELIDRRKRYWQIRKKIDNGEITHINDFITYNLNIRQFAQDVIDSHSDPDFIRHFYEALSNITILDPTCGSGAFLFAAMNILEPLYESCIQRMENFVAEAAKGKFKFFEKVLEQVKSPEHPNLRYFIYKSIILRNLYGVDIMKEAVEIAKLRLFLKLVATVEADYKKPNLGLEPLPDIDFNIRSGNTLIGYATKKEIDDLRGIFVTPKMKEQILEECDLVSKAFQRFKEIQLKGYEDKNEFTKAKTELYNRLDKLADNLNKILQKQNYEGYDYGKWLETHQPFHWFAEFYEIINDKGGFDVIIGNPPYVEYSKVKDTYRIIDYKTEKCGNLYAFVFERCFKISKNATGLIIQLSAISTETMKPLQEFLKTNSKIIYSSSFPERPKQLFDGACIALTIQLCFKLGNETIIQSAGINRTAEQAREYLFQNMTYTKIENEFIPKQHLFPKFKINIEKNIFNKIIKEKQLFNYIINKTGSSNSIFYRSAGGRYWKIFLNRNFKNESTSNKSKTFDKQFDKNTIVAVLNSNLFWWYFANYFDLYNLKDYMIFSFPFTFKNDSESIGKLGVKLMESFERNVETKEQYIQSKSQTTYFETFNPALSKEIIDEIDNALAKHYGFIEEELDFIINYDIKYRMSKELDNGEDE